jgi:hypothetical protein
MPFQFRVYFETIYKSFFLEAPWTPARVGILFFFTVLFPIAQIFNAITFYLDDVIFRGYRKVEVKNPVFIVGNGRSGTTYMHRLLATDTERFNTLTFADMFLLAVGTKKFFRMVGRIDKRFGGHLAVALEKFQAAVMKEADKVHKLRLNHPEEDDALLVHCWASTFLALVFPVDSMRRWERFDEMLPEKQRHKLMKFYKACIQRQLYVNGGRYVQLLSKNPLFSTKLKTIREIFPDAKIVYMARTPYQTVASIHNMIDRIWNVQLKLDVTARPREALTDMCIYTYQYALSELDRHDQSCTAIVRYEDLVHSPRETIESIYAKFGFEMSPAYREALIRMTEKTKGYKSEHQYSLEQFGLSKALIYNSARTVFDRFGFDPEGEFANETGLKGTQVA